MASRKSNPCKHLRTRILLELHKGSKDRKFRFDLEAVVQIVAPLPVETRERITKQFAAFARAYRNTCLYGRKCTNNSLNRLIFRLDMSLFKAEDALREKYNDWNEDDPSEIQAEAKLHADAEVVKP
jgi:hypothetical protein